MIKANSIDLLEAASSIAEEIERADNDHERNALLTLGSIIGLSIVDGESSLSSVDETINNELIAAAHNGDNERLACVLRANAAWCGGPVRQFAEVSNF